jgi:flagellar biosynthesis component FlhA
MICLKKWKGENESPDSFLSGYEVKNVKNGEEALSLVATHFDMIIYDAISEALSEKDINNMYQQKFNDARFMVLVDDLFPINA